MRKILKDILVAIFLSISFTSFSQMTHAWQKTFGSASSEDGFCVRPTTDGGYIISGIKNIDSLNTDIYLIKTDSLGDSLWVKRYGGPGGEFESIVEQTTDGGYVISGTTYSYGAGQGDVFVIKTNSIGDIVWNKTYGGMGDELGQSIQQTNDGGFIIGGHTDSFGPRGDFYLIKTDANGDTSWTRNYGGSQHDHGFCVQQTSDNGYIQTGHSVSFGTSGGFYAVKTNNLGDTLWTRGYGGAGDSYCYFGIQTNDGGYIFTGSTACFGSGYEDGLVVKTNSAGDTLWTKTYGGTASDFFNCVVQTSSGDYVLAGTTSSFGSGGTDIYLVKINSAGDTLWSKTIGGANDDEGTFVSISPDSGYVISGSTKSFGSGSSDVYLVKTDKYGNSGCYSLSAYTQITKPDSLMFSVATMIGLPPTVVGGVSFAQGESITFSSDVCSEIGIRSLSRNELLIKVFPSPSDGNVSIESQEEIGSVSVYDCAGKCVHRQRSNHTNMVLSIANLQAGIYIIEVSGKHFRIVKE